MNTNMTGYRDPYDSRREPPRAQGGDDVILRVLDVVIFGGLALLGRYCRELSVPAVPAALGVALHLRYGWPVPVAAGAGVGLLAGLLGWPWSRRLLLGWLYRGRVRRRVTAAFRRIDATPVRDRPPILRRIRRVPCGDQLTVALWPGMRQADVENMADALATALRVRAVRVERDRDDASLVTLTIVRRDPFAGPPLRWPQERAKRLSLWEPIPVGVGEDGQVVTVSLPERNVLLGGEPGAGKSVALSLLVATAALDPDVRLWLLDGKRVELAAWAGCAERVAGPDIAEANDLLRAVREQMDARYTALLARRWRKVQRGNGGDELGSLVVVVVDELAFYLTHPDRKARSEFADLLRDLVARGRAAGVIVLAATQKPAADVIPTSLRDLFGFRWALRCTTAAASDTVLGSGWAAGGYDASDVDPAARGVGWLLHEGGVPRLLRSYCLDDDTIDAIAERAEAGRGGIGPRDLPGVR